MHQNLDSQLVITPPDLKVERASDVERIKASNHPRKVVVAGPGTGKSHLFSELIKQKKAAGKSDFVAITFIGKLGDALADDLCGLAETMTMHGYARKFFLEQCPGWLYYPRIDEIIAEDLRAEGTTEFSIGDENYKRKSKEYQAVGDADVVVYAVQICKNNPKKIPQHDLILVDEYQDFNAIEAEFVDLLAQRSEMVVVGDDDQVLYEFKGSSPKFIRSKFSTATVEFESHTLRFCSRCTEVVVKYFHGLVEGFNLNDPAKERIQKDYICYTPEKASDSRANHQIHLIANCPVGMIAYKVRAELERLTSEQKIKDVLVIGEGRSCEKLLRTVATQLRNYGFRNVDYRGNPGVLSLNQRIIDAYRFLAREPSSVLGWRILANPAEPARAKHLANAKTLKAIIDGTPTALGKLTDDGIRALEKEIEIGSVSDQEVRRDTLFRQVKRANVHLPRPLSNLEITVCNILNSKGLGADAVFLLGFDQGRFPVKGLATDAEVYQMLVAITRAKKRLYLINTISKQVSSFGSYLHKEDVAVEEIKER